METDFTRTFTPESAEGKHADVEILVRTTRLHAHKYMLTPAKALESRLKDCSIQQPLQIREFPGGEQVFRRVLRFLYSAQDLSAVEVREDGSDFADLYCAASSLNIKALKEALEIRLKRSHFLSDPETCVKILARVSDLWEQRKLFVDFPIDEHEVSVNLIGTCLNALSQQFLPTPSLSILDPPYFSCVVRGARKMKHLDETLQEGVVMYCNKRMHENQSRYEPDGKPLMSVEHFLECVSSPGRITEHTDVRFVRRIFDFSIQLLNHLVASKLEDQRKILCESLQVLGLWDNLPYKDLRRAYVEYKDLILADCLAEAMFKANERLYQENVDLLRENDSLIHQLPKPAGSSRGTP